MLESLFLNRWLQKVIRPVRHIYTLAVILFTWLIFRAPNLEFVFNFLRLLAGDNHGHILSAFTDSSPLPFIEPSFVIAFVVGILLALPFLAALQRRIEKSVLLTATTDLLLFALFVLAVGMMASSTFLPGIYQGF